jgi:aspartate aminotransferase
MVISAKIQGFISQASWIRKMFEEGDNLKKQYGENSVFDFSLGNPNVEPPPKVKELLRRVVEDPVPNKHGYMPNAGYTKTREAVAAHLTEVHKIPVSYNHVIMTCGAGGALNVILKVLLDPGDEVIVLAPFFVEYRFYVDNAGGITRVVKTNDDFSLDLNAIEKAIMEKTKVVLINSPNNPTGKVYNEASIKALASLLYEKSKVSGKDICIVSDEPYSDIVYDGIKVPSILAACKNSIIASSYSKSLSLPGERIGYLAINPEINDAEKVIDAAIMCNRILGFVNAPALIQRVITGLQEVHVDVGKYRQKRDLLCDGLAEAGYRFNKPEGAFYLFVKSPIEDDVSFVKALVNERILTVPGSGFGGPGYFRIAYCVNDATIVNAMDGFRKTLREFSQ